MPVVVLTVVLVVVVVGVVAATEWLLGKRLDFVASGFLPEVGWGFLSHAHVIGARMVAWSWPPCSKTSW